MPKHICPTCNAIVFTPMSYHVCLTRPIEDLIKSVNRNGIFGSPSTLKPMQSGTPMPKTKPPKKESTMSHNEVKFKDMRSVEKAMLLLAKHEGEEIIGIDNTNNKTHHKMQEQGETTSFNWLDNYIYYVVPKAKVRPEPEYKTAFIDEEGTFWEGPIIAGREGTHLIEMQALKDALGLRHRGDKLGSVSTKTLDILLGFIK